MVDLYEERAVILSKLGEHESALTIYAHRLGDIEMAHQALLRVCVCVCVCACVYVRTYVRMHECM